MCLRHNVLKISLSLMQLPNPPKAKGDKKVV